MSTDSRRIDQNLLKDFESFTPGKSWLGMGITDVGQKLLAVVQAILFIPENRQKIMKDFTQGIISGIKGENLSNDSVQRHIISATKILSKETIGVISCITLYILLGHYEGQDIKPEDKKVLDASQKKLSEIFFGKNNASLEEVKESKQEVSQAQENSPASIQTLESAAEIAEKAKQILSKYHVFVLGIDFSNLFKSEESPLIKNIGNYNLSLNQCQNELQAILKEMSPLLEQKSADEQSILNAQAKEEELKQALKETSKALDEFCEKMSFFASMKSVDAFFGNKRADEEYKKIVQEPNRETIEKNFLGPFFKPFRFLVKFTFSIMQKIMRPLITSTIERLLNEFRNFFKDEERMLEFSRHEVEELDNYLGLFRFSAKQYLKGDHNKGSFKLFREDDPRFTKFGTKSLTKEELIDGVEKYLVDNIPPPSFSTRIPIITSAIESIVWKIRKKLVSSFLKKSQIVSTYLVEGKLTHEAAQIALKEVIEEKLKLFKAALTNEPTSQKESKPPSPSLESMRETIRKNPHISNEWSELSLKIDEFISIAECNGDSNRLKKTLKPKILSSGVNEMVTAITNLAARKFNLKENLQHLSEPLVAEALQKTCTKLTQSIVEQMFSRDLDEVEKQICRVITVARNSFLKTDSEEMQHLNKTTLNTLNISIENLLNEISELATNKAVQETLSGKLSKETYARVKGFVETQKAIVVNWKNQIQKAAQAYLKVDVSHKNNIQTLIELSSITSKLLNHISLLKQAKGYAECYEDVKIELKKAFSLLLADVLTIVQSFGKLAKNHSILKNIEDKQEVLKKLTEGLETISENSNLDEVVKIVERLSEESKQLEQMKLIPEQLKELAKVQKQLQRMKTFQPILKQKVELQEKITSLDQLEKIFETMQNNVRALHSTQSSEAIKNLEAKIEEEKQKFLTTLEKTNLLTVSFFKQVKLTLSSETNILISNKFFSKKMFRKHGVIEQIIAHRNMAKSLESVLNYRESALLKEFKEETPDNLSDKIAQAKISFDELKAQISASFKAEKSVLASEKEKTVFLSKALCEEIDKLSFNMSESFNKTEINGYLCLWEKELYAVAAPSFSEEITPIVVRKMNTIAAAISEPFHWKQLIMRLGIARFTK